MQQTIFFDAMDRRTDADHAVRAEVLTFSGNGSLLKREYYYLNNTASESTPATLSSQAFFHDVSEQTRVPAGQPGGGRWTDENQTNTTITQGKTGPLPGYGLLSMDGKGPVMSQEEAERWSANSADTNVYWRGSHHPGEGVIVPKVSKNMSMLGRGVYMMTDKEGVSKWGDASQLRINVRKPLNYYSPEAKPLEATERYKELVEHFDKSGVGNWQTARAAAMQVVAQEHGYDAMYYVSDDGIRVMCVFDPTKVAVIKDHVATFHATFAADEKKMVNIPKGAIKIDVPDVRQQTNFSCGAASMKAVAHYYGVGPRDEPSFIKLLGTNTKDGTEPSHLIDYAEKLGLDVTAKEKMSMDDLVSALEDYRPVIVAIQAWGKPARYPANKEGHYVVAIGFDDKNIYVEDPVLKGVRGFRTREEFDKQWHDIDGAGEVLDHWGLIFRGKPGDGPSDQRAEVVLSK